MCDYWNDSVRLRYEKWDAEIWPFFGMNTVSLRFDGRELLRKPENAGALSDSPYLYGIPLLFPANRVAGGTFAFMGKTHRLPINEPARNNHIHGLMYNAPFRIVNKTQKSVEAEYINKGERYPFPFKMTIVDALSEKGYERKISILNTSDNPFPYTLAFHTSFLEPETLSVFVKDRFLCDKNYIPTGKTAELNNTEKQYIKGVKLKNLALSGFYRMGENAARLDDILFSVSENFDEWILFNAGGDKGFVCVEPQAGEVNGLNTKSGCRILREGETHTYTLSISREEKK